MTLTMCSIGFMEKVKAGGTRIRAGYPVSLELLCPER